MATFNFDATLSVKDREETFSLDEEFQTINLLSKIAVEKQKRNVDILILVRLRLHSSL